MAKQSESAESQPAAAERAAGKGGGARRGSQRGSAARSRASTRRGKTPAALQKHLKGQHAQLDALFQRYEAAEEGGKEQALRELAQELILQMTVKEQVLYPALQEVKVDDVLINEALVSYDVAKLLLRDILDGRGGDRYIDAKVAMLAQTVEHHVAKEEQPRQGLLAKATGIDDAAVVSRMQERRKALEAEGEGGLRDPGPVVTLNSQYGNRQSGYSRHPGEEQTMPQHGPERDEHGRFMSNDDHRGGRGYGGGSGGGGGRGRMMEEDDRGRGMQSRGGRSHEDDDDYRGRGRSGGGGGGRGQGGWFGDSEGHSQASRQGWQTRYREGTEHDSGWHGDPQGHSEASRRGWDTRYREGTEHDSGWHGDPQGHSEASRRGWETRYREGTEHESGWHGDPEGHSEASRRGWETRRREGTDRFMDDDRGNRGRYGGGNERGYGGGGRGGYESEGRGGSRSMSSSGGGSRSSSYGSGGGGRDQGQGGWFGDSEGHSEASRRGWEHRRHDDDDDRGGRGRR